MKTRVSDFNESTCELFHPVQIFIGIHAATAGNPCTTGCVFFDGGRCKGYLNLIKDNKPKHVPKRTNAEIGAELHCSPRQVAKMRKEGRLPSHIA